MNMDPSILTYTGIYFSFIEPRQSQFDIYDIAHGLSQVCRFAGQTQTFYSVAQHSVYVSKIVDPEFALVGLLHDAAEAFIGDVATPLKQLLPEYRRIERRVEVAIFERFDIAEIPKQVKDADLTMLATEQAQLMVDHDDVWPILKDVVALPFGIEPLSPIAAENLFLERYYEVKA